MLQVYEKESVTCIEMTGPELKPVFAFLTDGLLIDTGIEWFEPQLSLLYKELSFDKVVLTHSHEDHIGTATWIQKNLAKPIYIHPKGIPNCKKETTYPKFRKEILGIRQAFSPLVLDSDFTSRTKKWEVIETPGHSDDHISLYDKETKTLYSGDLYISPRPKLIMRSESIPQLITSIQRVISLDFDSVFCSHAGHLKNGKEKLHEKLEYLIWLSSEIKMMNSKGFSFEEINDKLFGRKYTITSESGGEWDSLHIITSVLLE